MASIVDDQRREDEKRVFSITLSVCVVALTAAIAFAQLPGETIRVNIPFDFLVRGRSLPAGEYEISRLNDEPEVLAITNIRKPS
jgi:hypothetical protein